MTDVVQHRTYQRTVIQWFSLCTIITSKQTDVKLWCKADRKNIQPSGRPKLQFQFGSVLHKTEALVSILVTKKTIKWGSNSETRVNGLNDGTNEMSHPFEWTSCSLLPHNLTVFVFKFINLFAHYISMRQTHHWHNVLKWITSESMKRGVSSLPL